MYHELILTSKEYMTQVTAVDPYWPGCVSFCLSLIWLLNVNEFPFVAELGSVLYSVKEKNFDDRGE